MFVLKTFQVQIVKGKEHDTSLLYFGWLVVEVERQLDSVCVYKIIEEDKTLIKGIRLTKVVIYGKFTSW